MGIEVYVQRLRKVPFLLRRFRHVLFEYFNDEFCWDEYVKGWEKTRKTEGLKCLGNEWTGEEGFLALLEKYASTEKQALEIGCGGGRITSTGVKLFKHVFAADISDQMLRKCREGVAAPNLTFHKLDAFTLKEFASASEDLVYSHDVFVHFSSLQVYSYFREIKRVLRSQGVGLISFFDFVSHFELFRNTSLEFWERQRFPTHMRLHFITEETLRTMLADLEMNVLEFHRDDYLTIALAK